MEKSTLMKQLKVVNEKASEVIAEVQKTTDPMLISALIYELANTAWTLGVHDGRKDMAQEVAERVK